MTNHRQEKRRPNVHHGRRRRHAAQRGPLRNIRRGLRRLYRRHPKARVYVRVASASLCLLAVVGLISWGILAALPKPDRVRPVAEVAAPPMTAPARVTEDPTGEPPTSAPTAQATFTAEPTSTVEHTSSPEPTDSPRPALVPGPTFDPALCRQTAAPSPDYADPARNGLLTDIQVFSEDTATPAQADETAAIHMGGSDGYTVLEGVTTFRGSNYRDGGSYGAIPENPTRLTEVWQKRIHSLDDWTGVGWTGQGSLVRWPEELRKQMNIKPEKRDKDGLVEVIYATLDGHIYFLDMEDGAKTREAIDIDAPIKGSLTVDPRGLPLLYCGQGIYDVGGKRVACGTRIWSLIDQKLLYFLDGKDPAAHRSWAAFDCSPLVDGESDTMVTAGENGVLYKVKLNTASRTGSVAVNPSVTRYVYQYAHDKNGKLGTENSVAIYNSYVYFATNTGVIQCVDLNDMSLVWSFEAKDDIDASLVVEPEADGLVALYAANELDRRGHNGRSQMFKLNALTGELLWCKDSDPIHQRDDNGGGSFATPAVGKRDLSGLVYYHVCRTRQGEGILYALDKATGETAWSLPLGAHGWSSPTCVYTASGKGYVLVGSSNGRLRLLDGLTGEEATSIKLRGNIEGTPAVFDDMIVVGTRSCRIYGVRIE